MPYLFFSFLFFLAIFLSKKYKNFYKVTLESHLKGISVHKLVTSNQFETFFLLGAQENLFF